MRSWSTTFGIPFNVWNSCVQRVFFSWSTGRWGRAAISSGSSWGTGLLGGSWSEFSGPVSTFFPGTSVEGGNIFSEGPKYENSEIERTRGPEGLGLENTIGDFANSLEFFGKLKRDSESDSMQQQVADAIDAIAKNAPTLSSATPEEALEWIQEAAKGINLDPMVMSNIASEIVGMLTEIGKLKGQLLLAFGNVAGAKVDDIKLDPKVVLEAVLGAQAGMSGASTGNKDGSESPKSSEEESKSKGEGPTKESESGPGGKSESGSGTSITDGDKADKSTNGGEKEASGILQESQSSPIIATSPLPPQKANITSTAKSSDKKSEGIKKEEVTSILAATATIAFPATVTTTQKSDSHSNFLPYLSVLFSALFFL
ncbi:hypothetical protein BDR26DRAFT_245250 [Obelidium mucronatum]|nr:hypothetical protein BDR26DRAFT_245250 [Obelidium mucronatum]